MPKRTPLPTTAARPATLRGGSSRTENNPFADASPPSSSPPSDDEDDVNASLLGGGRGGAGSSSVRSGKADEVKAQMGEVMGVLQQSITKVMDRGERIEDLQEKTGEMQQTLAASSIAFQRQSVDTRRTAQLRNLRTKIVIGASALLVLIGLIVWLVHAVKH
ncbi:hypothetical protein RI367_007551 [Sorochytrium milnesiophthora]